jgi:YcxB-like protein
MPTIDYQLTKRELIFTGTLRKLGRPRTLIGIGGIFLVGVFLVIVGYPARILGWFLIAYVILFPVLLARAGQQFINANPVFTSQTHLTFTDSGIVSEASGLRSERPWASFQSWSHSDKYFFLHTDNLGTAVTVPKRAFTESQMESFFDHLSHIGGNLVSAQGET